MMTNRDDMEKISQLVQALLMGDMPTSTNIEQHLNKMDVYGLGFIDYKEFRAYLMKEVEIKQSTLTEVDLQRFFSSFKTVGPRELTCQVNATLYPVRKDDLLRELKGPIPDNRLLCINAAFDKLDANRSGSIEKSDFRHFLMHNLVESLVSGNKSVQQVVADCLVKFGVKKHVCWSEFHDHYWNLSLSINCDVEFLKMICDEWHMSEADVQAYATLASWAPPSTFPQAEPVFSTPHPGPSHSSPAPGPPLPSVTRTKSIRGQSIKSLARSSSTGSVSELAGLRLSHCWGEAEGAGGHTPTKLFLSALSTFRAQWTEVEGGFADGGMGGNGDCHVGSENMVSTSSSSTYTTSRPIDEGRRSDERNQQNVEGKHAEQERMHSLPILTKPTLSSASARGSGETTMHAEGCRRHETSSGSQRDDPSPAIILTANPLVAAAARRPLLSGAPHSLHTSPTDSHRPSLTSSPRRVGAPQAPLGDYNVPPSTATKRRDEAQLMRRRECGDAPARRAPLGGVCDECHPSSSSSSSSSSSFPAPLPVARPPLGPAPPTGSRPTSPRLLAIMRISGGHCRGPNHNATLGAVSTTRHESPHAPCVHPLFKDYLGDVQAFCQAAGRKLQFLVVDDSQIVRKVMRKLLTDNGHEVREAYNGLECLQMLSEEGGEGLSFDIILMDNHMPELDGVLACQEVRDRGLGIPIIAVTAYASDEDCAAFRAHGANYVLPKPLRMDKLTKALEEMGSNANLTFDF